MTFPVAKIGNTRIYVHVTFLLAALVLIGSGYALYFLVFLGSLMVHEMGHLIASAFLGAEITEVELWPFGAVGKLEGVWQLEPWPEAMVAISGPLQSAMLAAIGFLSYMALASRVPGVQALGQFPLLEFLIKVNLGLLAINLMPCLPLDGGRFIRAQLSLRAGYKEASTKVANLGIWLAVMSSVIGVVGIFAGYDCYTLVLFGPLVIWGSIEEKQGAALHNALSLLARNERLARKRAISVEEIMVREDVQVKDVVQRLRPSKYFVILVVDRRMTVLGSITETRLLEAFYRGLVNVKVKELI
jgi:stage IV sporulation protein FB